MPIISAVAGVVAGPLPSSSRADLGCVPVVGLMPGQAMGRTRAVPGFELVPLVGVGFVYQPSCWVEVDRRRSQHRDRN